MSIIPIGLTLLQATVLNLINPILIRQRNIAGFIPNVTVRESHRDELVVTDHPVEQGAQVSDHAYKRPSSVLLEVGYSNSALAGLGDPNYVQDTYQDFLALQASRVPFDIVTGKRSYTNMMLTSIATTTDEKTEYSLPMVLECREVILVNTQTVSVDPTNLKNPQLNSATSNSGTQQLQPAPNYNFAGQPTDL